MSYHNRTLDELKTAFWSKVDKTDSCWLWTSNKRGGYGTVTIRGRCKQAQIVSWLLANKDIKTVDELLHEYAILGNQDICHTCDNKACVYPAHLYLASHQDNIWESVLSGTNVKLTAKEVVEIRDLYATGYYTNRELGNIYGVSYSQVHRIVLFKRRKHLNI